MANPNVSSDTSEEKNVQKKSNNILVHSLLKEAIIREFGSPIDPKKFDAYKSLQGEYYDRIRTHMYDLKRLDMSEWGSVENDQISEIKGIEMGEQILQSGKQLVFMRKRAFDRALELFPNIKNQGADWMNILNFAIKGLNENELKDHVTRTALMKNLIHKYFTKLQGETLSEIRDFEKIFHDSDIILDESSKKRFRYIFSEYKRFHQIPDTSDIYFILEKYAGVSISRKKEILTALGVTLTFKQAFEYELINTSFLEKFSKDQFGDAYMNLDEEQKKSFIRSLQYDESQLISASDFDLTGLDAVFSDEKKLRILSRETFRTLGLDLPEPVSKKEPTIAGDIRNQKRSEYESALLKNPSLGEESYDMYDEFIHELQSRLRTSSGEPMIDDLELLKTTGAVISFEHSDFGTQYIRIKRVRDSNGYPIDEDNGDNYGLDLEGFSVVDNKIQQSEFFSYSYDNLFNFLKKDNSVNILKSEDFDHMISNKTIGDNRQTNIDPPNAQNIAEKLNTLDPEGSEFGFEVGTCFIAPSQEAGGGGSNNEDVWKIQKIHGDTVDLMDSNGKQLVKGFPIVRLYELLQSSPSFKRTAKIKDDTDMLLELQKYGVNQDASIKDGNITIKEKDDHGHHIDTKLTCFAHSKDAGQHLIIESIQDGVVRFGEYKNEEDTKKMKDHIKTHGFDKSAKTHYSWQNMSYPAFLNFLETKKFRATIKNPVIPDGTTHDLHADHTHHPHVHGSLWSRIMQMQNPASIMKGFEMIWHGIEHTLEKGAKLDAAKFALKTAKIVGLPDSVSAQIYADVVEGSKEIVEKYEKKIFDLPGPRGREKCLHIIENHDSRPEEIVAAMNYMLKSYGHLYAEDIKYKQSIVENKEQCINAPSGTFMFFDAFVVSSKIGDLKHWREKAYNKAIAEMGTVEEHEGEPTEEQLIHALFKNIDGDWDQFPYAASVVKAVGGPGGFEKTWKFEGFENAHKKGMDQTKMVSTQGRLNKSVGYIETHEIYKAMGAMESMAFKTKDPKYQAMPFIWAVGGYSQYASHTALQKLKGYAENGLSFHGFAFIRNKKDNDAYRDTVKIALREIGGSSLEKEFDSICELMKFDSDNPKKTKGGALKMMEFWQKHYASGLHDMLQGQNGWLVSKCSEGNETVKQYVETFAGAHAMQLDKNAIPGGDNGPDWYDEHGYQNMIFAKGPDGLRSLSSTLNKIKFDGTSPAGGRDMNDDHYKKIWVYLMKYMNDGLKDPKYFHGNGELQKKQYLFHRKEILDYFARQLSTRSTEDREGPEKALAIAKTNIKNYPFYSDLASMGIDPMGVFYDTVEESGEESDYQKWLSTGSVISSGNIQKSRKVPSVKEMVAERSNEVMSQPVPGGQKVKKNIMRVNEDKSKKTKRTARVNKEKRITDDDSLYPGGSADASDPSEG